MPFSPNGSSRCESGVAVVDEEHRGGSRAMERISCGELKPARILADFVTDVLAGSTLSPEAFWSGLGKIVQELGPRNRALLGERDRLQSAIDEWHRGRRGQPLDLAAYQAFLRKSGYLRPEPGPLQVETSGVDAEI